MSQFLVLFRNSAAVSADPCRQSRAPKRGCRALVLLYRAERVVSIIVGGFSRPVPSTPVQIRVSSRDVRDRVVFWCYVTNRVGPGRVSRSRVRRGRRLAFGYSAFSVVKPLLYLSFSIFDFVRRGRVFDNILRSSVLRWVYSLAERLYREGLRELRWFHFNVLDF